MLRFYSFASVPALLSLAALACGAAPTSLVAPTPVASATAAPAAAASAVAAPVPSARRLPSETLLRYWPFDAPPTATLYADLGGLLKTELGSSVLPAVLALTHASTSEAEAQCLRGAAASVREIVFGADASGAGILIASYDDGAFDLTPCLTAEGAQPVQLAGAQQAFSSSDSLLVHVPGVFLAGPEPSIKRALGAHASSAAFPPDLALGTSEFVTWSATIDQNALRGSLLASMERFRLGVEANVSEADAKDAEAGLSAIKQKKIALPGVKGPEAEMLGKLLQSVTLERTGSHLSGAFDLHEPPVEQARDIGVLTALSIYGVRKYVAAAKAEEAKGTLLAIAGSYAKAWTPPVGSRGARKLVSFPPVPAAVPKGTKYSSTPSDWKAWQAIDFELHEPQYYQYEVRAAKDGRTADIIARGDLDADGKQSEFRIHVTQAKDKLAIGENIEEHDPEE